MKRAMIVVLLLALAMGAAFAQFRLDIGITIPKGMGAAQSGDVTTFDEAADFLSTYFIPLPEASLLYKADLGMFKVGGGVRSFTVILASFLWPNLFAEVELGPVILEAQIGGGLFGYYALAAGGFETGNIFIPDLSAWFAVGKKKILRLGGGAMGFLAPDLFSSDTVPFLLYFGGKAAIDL
jgi:hypothetical protein